MIGVRILCGLGLCTSLGLYRETRLAGVDISSEGSNSDELDAWQGSTVEI